MATISSLDAITTVQSHFADTPKATNKINLDSYNNNVIDNNSNF